MGTAFPNKFNAFESTSQDNRDNPQTIATSDLKNKITLRLNQIGIGSGCQLTQEHILNRAGALSCGGCHQFTVDKPVAAGVNWPKSARFVHIDETGGLSPALDQFFLPARQQNFTRHLQPAPAPPPAPPPAAGPQYPRGFGDIRQKVAGVAGAEYRLSAINLLTEIEKQVQSERAAEQATPGAFVPFRRPH